ncbi:hypothetical protein L7F22_016207 [Adiantum nelumboides]|nr:hypothetical protein [Adiantum nelumboides]
MQQSCGICGGNDGKYDEAEDLLNYKQWPTRLVVKEVAYGEDGLPLGADWMAMDSGIRQVKGLAGCPMLRQLNISGNYVRTEDDVLHLLVGAVGACFQSYKGCETLQSLDISNNKIDDQDALKVVRKLSLSLLRMNGNPVVSKARYYRKATIVSIPMLNYLDDSPVFAKERRLAEAWEMGGTDAEKAMRDTIKSEEALERESHSRAFEDMLAKAKAESEEAQLHTSEVEQANETRVLENLTAT